MKKMFITIPLILMGMLIASTALAHDGAHDEEKSGHGMYEEGSSGSAMEMDRKSRAMAHEYKDEHGGMGGDHGGEHSKEYYEKKYGKYEHKKDHMKDEGHSMKEEGSGMKDEAMKMKEMEHKRMDEGSKM
ncbi:MAG: hypothetical protein HOK41_04225 [Nitrospina sp.]|jgi:hypothetical protein|nr:hypothetical protein [Nitrospina sp.]MBT6717288.1 hypothetical protein [Nitrospina sp.]